MDNYIKFLIGILCVTCVILIVAVILLYKKHKETKELKQFDLQANVNDKIAIAKQNKRLKATQVEVRYEDFEYKGEYGTRVRVSKIKTYIQIWYISLLNDSRINKKHRKLYPNAGPVVMWRIVEDENEINNIVSKMSKSAKESYLRQLKK